MMSLLLQLTVIAGVFGTLGLSQNLICYNCDPVNDSIEECLHPVEKNARYTVCPVKENTTNLCLSAYIQTEPRDNKTLSGIYRDCISKPLEVADVCDWLKETKPNSTFKSCHPCNETRCNTKMLYPDGTSSASSYNLSLLIFINIILFITFC